MKKIGTTNKDNIVLEVSRDEYRALVHLAKSIEGRDLEYVHFRDDYHLTTPDYSGVFGSIEAYALANYRINELQLIINRFKEVLQNREDE